MTSISRKLPQSNPSRLTALRVAHTKANANAVNAAVLRSPTFARLLAIYPLFKAGMDAILAFEIVMQQSTVDKNTAQSDCKIYTSHFLQTVMMAVERKEMNATVLAGYGLAVSNPKVPALVSEQDIVSAAENTVTGENARVALGGTPLPMPTLAQVQLRLTGFSNALTNQSDNDDHLDSLQEAVENMIEEADGVIRKIWDEIETVYNEETIESKRENARQWGVVYISDSKITISGIIVGSNAAGNVIIEGATILLVEAEKETTSAANGAFEIETGYSGAATLEVSAEGYRTKTVEIEIAGDVNVNLGELLLLPAPIITPA
jgi:hypothetical protein